MADGLAKMWEDAKTSFKDINGKSKPKESKGLLNAFGSFTGLSGSLEKFDKLQVEAEALTTAKVKDYKAGNKKAADLEGLLTTFKKASKSYTAVLEKSIAGDIDAREEKDAKSTYERALKFLKKSLTAIEETGSSRIEMLVRVFKEDEKDFSIKEKMLLAWKKNIDGALARAVAAAAKVKADPTVATYNSIFPKAARDVTMQLVFTKDLDGFLMDPKDALKGMQPWGEDGGKPPARLPDTATEDHVKKFLGAFIVELKKTQQLVATKGRYR